MTDKMETIKQYELSDLEVESIVEALLNNDATLHALKTKQGEFNLMLIEKLRQRNK